MLDIPSKATNSDVKSAYLRKSKELHPDVNSSPEAKDDFLEVQKAYDILSKSHLRHQYDRKLFFGDRKEVKKKSAETEEFWRPTHHKKSQPHFDIDQPINPHLGNNPYPFNFTDLSEKDPLHPESEQFKRFEKRLSDRRNQNRVSLVSLVFVICSCFYFAMTDP